MNFLLIFVISKLRGYFFENSKGATNGGQRSDHVINTQGCNAGILSIPLEFRVPAVNVKPVIFTPNIERR